LGGGEDSSVTYLSITRENTDIELSIIDYFLKQIVMILRHAWTNYFPVDPILDSIATNSRLMQTISPDETVVIVVMKATVNELSGTINICLPKTTLDIVFSRL
jgi:flagellar motor switch protein FliM